MKVKDFLRNRILFAVGMLLAESQIAHAQAMDAPPGPSMMYGAPHRPHAGRPMHAGPNGMYGMNNPMPPFLFGVELTEAQQDKIFDIMHNLAPQFRDRTKAANKAKKELHNMVMSQNFDEAKAKTLADTLARTQADIMLMHLRANHQIFAMLTPEQRQQIETRKKNHPMPVH